MKNTAFKPEFTKRLNFYLSPVDSMVKEPEDNLRIGIHLYKGKDNIEAEFALRSINKPIGISKISFVEKLPDNLKNSLPTREEIENKLRNFGNNS